MVTVLDKVLRRQVTVDGVAYTVAIDSEGFRLTGKGKRKPEVQLLWRDLLSGEAAMAVALNASLGTTRQAATSADGSLSQVAGKRMPMKLTRKPGAS